MLSRTLTGLLLVSMGLAADQQRSAPLVNQNLNQVPAFAVLEQLEQLAFSARWRDETKVIIPRGGHGLIVVTTGEGRCNYLLLQGNGGEVRQAEQWVLMPANLDTPSSEGGRAGVYYDALLPLNPTSCQLSPFRLIEWKPELEGIYRLSMAGKSLLIDVRFDGKFQRPDKPMFMGLSNSFLIAGHCRKYCPMEKPLGDAYRKLLIDHHLTPLQSWVLPLEINAGQLSLDRGAERGLSFRQQGWGLFGYWREFPRLPATDHTVWLSALEATLGREQLAGRGWVYVRDEPDDFSALKSELALYRKHAPSVRTMVTTPWRQDLAPLVDIWSPNIAHWQPELRGYRGKEVWPYLSCQGSCGPNRRVDLNAIKDPGPDTGLPDLLIDRPVARLAAYFRQLSEGGAAGGLYYHAVEGYPLWREGVDLINDPWNFGGNGDGLLIYPGRPGEWGLDSHQPLPSFRLKMMRQFIERHWAAP